jgi:ribosome-binding factor A
LQLCRQVQKALMLALGGECMDEVLRNVYVESVEPMSSASQLLVRVAIPSGTNSPSLEVLARLNERAPRLRAIVAQSICRKRAPSLSFTAVPVREEMPERGQP